MCVCVSVTAFAHYCTDPDVTWGNGRGCPLVVHYWADMQSVHRFRCYDNIASNMKCQRVLVLAQCLAVIILLLFLCPYYYYYYYYYCCNMSVNVYIAMMCWRMSLTMAAVNGACKCFNVITCCSGSSTMLVFIVHRNACTLFLFMRLKLV